MEDDRVWDFESSLWTGDAEHYAKCIEGDALMALPVPPYIFSGNDAVKAVSDTPRWSGVDLQDGRIARPQHGLIVVAYTAHAKRDGEDDYVAHCTSTYRLNDDHDWQVVQHQQTPKLGTT